VKHWRAVFLLILCFAAGPVFAINADERLKDAAQEQRARGLSAELRCLVCQNQSIDDSDATLAKDLRRLVRERIAAGDSDGEVLAFVVARYGEFVLLRPPFNIQTLLLWGLPFLALSGGAVFILLRRRKTFAAPEPLTDVERQALETVLADADRKA
jgi:cytochrome c-type biogenesis protein CcmH